MATEALFFNRAVVFAAGVIYWAGVWVQVRRVRRRTGRSANSRPRGIKEQLLWAGWFFIVAAWLALPFLSAGTGVLPGAAVVASLVHPAGCVLGIIMMVAGYAGTLWCYATMGTAWRMGINREEKTELVTTGPYRFVRHPIYLFQVVMVAAVAVLLPSPLAAAILVIHLLCALTKAADEEDHLRTSMGPTYEAYRASTGRWFPRWRRIKPVAAPLPSGDRAP
jgi:protein-S-isoprenylcysteine O-methyltransferase Ste14